MNFINALIPWVALVILAIINGTIRQKVLLPKVGEQKAHVIGTITFILVQFFVIYFYIQLNSITETSTLLILSMYWIVLTVLFEFVFGHYVMKHPWEKLLADYNVLKGRLWVLVLINNLVAPLISGRLLT
ncbi:MAG: hypothetical protein MUO34_05760 [Ignavibacteriaceae bacterium]|nr:hypothetical protein [Ignavibacteriaceae bacterium]